MSLNPQESIDILNLARSMELVAIGQYMQHHYALDNLMFPTFAKAVKKIAISQPTLISSGTRYSSTTSTFRN